MSKEKYAIYLKEYSNEVQQKEYPLLNKNKEVFFKTGDHNRLNWLGHVVSMEASLYIHSKEKIHLDNCKKAIFTLCDIQDELISLAPDFTESENIFIEALKNSFVSIDYTQMPIIESVFTYGPAIKGITLLNKISCFTDKEMERIEKLSTAELGLIFNEAEWGAHNRCVLRAILLYLFSELFADNPISHKAAILSRRMFEQSLGKWSIEDASGYTPIWLNCVTEYVVYSGYWDGMLDTVLGYYANYFASIMLPSGGIPEYGDGRFDSGTASMLTLGTVEFMAAKRHDGFLKYAAKRIFDNFEERRTQDNSTQTERGLSNALLWADDSIAEQLPKMLSCEGLDDLVGKKIVLRSSWDKTADYLFYNYRDVGMYGRAARENLKNSIPVHAEKPHHGHADEQSIAALCANGAVFLRDGGYRDKFTIDAHYRGDFYHNRVILRNGRMLNEKGLIEYAENIGEYLPVTTEKIFFERFEIAEALRTRLYDQFHNAECDRTIIWLKEERVYVVIDHVKAIKQCDLTSGVLYFAENIEHVEKGLYRIPKETDEGLAMFYDKKPSAASVNRESKQTLLIAFVNKELPVSMEPIRRNYRQEIGLSQYTSRYFKQNEVFTYVSLLIPETGNTSEEIEHMQKRAVELAQSTCLKLSDNGNVTLEIFGDTGHYTIGAKGDDNYGIADLNNRPAYEYQTGKSVHGNFETDALLFVARESKNVEYCFVEATRADHKGKTIFQVEPYKHLQLDYSRKSGVWKWGSYEDKVQL